MDQNQPERSLLPTPTVRSVEALREHYFKKTGVRLDERDAWNLARRVLGILYVQRAVQPKRIELGESTLESKPARAQAANSRRSADTSTSPSESTFPQQWSKMRVGKHGTKDDPSHD